MLVVTVNSTGQELQVYFLSLSYVHQVSGFKFWEDVT